MELRGKLYFPAVAVCNLLVLHSQCQDGKAGGSELTLLGRDSWAQCALQEAQSCCLGSPVAKGTSPSKQGRSLQPHHLC